MSRQAAGPARNPLRGRCVYRVDGFSEVSSRPRGYCRTCRTPHRTSLTPDEERSLVDQRGPAELAETRLTIEEVFAAVRELPDAQREVILLRFASGLTVAETAAALGKKQPNVKVLQHKGVQRLRALFATSEAQRTSGR